MEQQKDWPELQSEITNQFQMIQIASFEEGCITGFFYHPFTNRGAEFFSELELLQMMDQWMNHIEYPQSTVRYRDFMKRKKRNPKGDEELMDSEALKDSQVLSPVGNPDCLRSGDSRATFIVRVQFRQNATWQGNIQWADAQRSKPFRSVLEMLTLMNSALGTADNAVWDEENTEQPV